ncbi:MAG: tetratricopeptide repeat protein [Terriglobales bacterium]|jgi:hypothetical protein
MSRAQTLARARAQARKRPQSRKPSGTGAFLTGKNLNTALCVLLAVVTIGLYSPVTKYSFVRWDDDVYVTANPYIRDGLSWSTVKWAFTSTETAANWHPLTWLSHALDYQLFALNPAGHHLDSVLIHALNAVLLFLLLAWVTKRVGPSLLVAALFALHPVNVESVAWVAERKNVLSAFFFLAAIGAYAWYAQKPEWRRYLLVAGLFAAGLMAKPMVITLPFVLLLLDYWPLDRMPLDAGGSGGASDVGVPRMTFSRLVLEKIPLLFLSAASAWITLVAQRADRRNFAELPLGIRIENAVVSYGLYLWKMLGPLRLAALYPYPENVLPVWQVTLFALMLLVGTAWVLVFRRKRYLAVGWFWFLGTLIPVIGLVQVGKQAMADRYAYIPLIGIFVMIAWGLYDWAEAKQVRTVWRVIPALCVLTVLGFVTSRQRSYWESEYALWTHALEVTERNPVAYNALATALLTGGSALTQNDLESFPTQQERVNEARRNYERALELRRQSAQQNYDPHAMALVLNNLGTVDGMQNRLDDARQHFEEALEIYRQLAQHEDTHLTDLAGTLNNLGNVDGFQNRMDEARLHYEEALNIYRQQAQRKPDKYLPHVAQTLDLLCALDRNQNRMEEARAHYREALGLYRKLSQSDNKYSSDVARIEAALQQVSH